MANRGIQLAVIVGAVLSGGCFAVPRPYKCDPLIQNEKRQKGNFEKAVIKRDRPLEPLGPPAPADLPHHVSAEVQKPNS